MSNPLLRPGQLTSKIHPFFSTSASPTSGHASSASATWLPYTPTCLLGPGNPLSTKQREWSPQHVNLMTLVLENLHDLRAESNWRAMAWETFCDGHLPGTHSAFLSCPVFISHYTRHGSFLAIHHILQALSAHSPSAWNAAHRSTTPSFTGILCSLNITSSEILPRPLYLNSLLNWKFSQAISPLSPLNCKLKESRDPF